MATLTWVFSGDKDKAKAYAGEALRKRALLQNAHMQVDTWRSPPYTMQDGTTIRLQSIFGQDKIWINSPRERLVPTELEMQSSYVVFGGGYSDMPHFESRISLSGKILWTVHSLTDGYEGSSRSIKIVGNLVYSVGWADYELGGGETLHQTFVECRKLQTGEFLWRKLAPANTSYTRLFPDYENDGYIYVAGAIFANPADPQLYTRNPWRVEKWKVKENGSPVEGIIQWSLDAPSIDDGPAMDLVLVEDSLYLATQAIYAYPDWISGAKLISINKKTQEIEVVRTYTPSYSYGLYRLATDGKSLFFTDSVSSSAPQGGIERLGKWRIPVSSTIIPHTITTDGNNVYLAEANYPNYSLYKLKLSDGSTTWKMSGFEGGANEIAVNDEGLYVTGYKGVRNKMTRKHSKSNGSVLWSWIDTFSGTNDVAYTIDAVTVKDK